jgi:hypothetical protein
MCQMMHLELSQARNDPARQENSVVKTTGPKALLRSTSSPFSAVGAVLKTTLQTGRIF